MKEYGEYLGPLFTNNEAEYQAVIFAFKKIKALFGKKTAKDLSVEINSDSELLVRQLKGEYKVINKKIQQLFLKVWNDKTDFQSVKFNQISREDNNKADKLVNIALDEQLGTNKLF